MPSHAANPSDPTAERTTEAGLAFPGGLYSQAAGWFGGLLMITLSSPFDFLPATCPVLWTGNTCWLRLPGGAKFKLTVSRRGSYFPVESPPL